MQTSPGLADLLLAELPPLDKLDGRLAVVLGVALTVFLLPHWLAARALAPQSTPSRIFATALIQLAAVLVSIAAQGYVLSFVGSTGAAFAGMVILLIFALVTAAIYEFGFFRGLAYNAIVGVFLLCAGWAADRLYFREDGGLIAKFWGPAPASAEALKEIPAPATAIAVTAKPALVAAGPTVTASSLPVTPRFATVQDAQAAAIARYAELAKSGSPFNQRFLEKHAAYKAKNDPILNSPDWPMRIATEVAGDLAAR